MLGRPGVDHPWYVQSRVLSPLVGVLPTGYPRNHHTPVGGVGGGGGGGGGGGVVIMCSSSSLAYFTGMLSVKLFLR